MKRILRFTPLVLAMTTGGLVGCDAERARTGASADSATLVPWHFAEARGGSLWSEQARSAFDNDPENRWPLSAKAAKTRGAKGPQDWLPTSAQCRYIARFVSIMEEHGLDQDPREMSDLRSQRQRCYTQFQ